MLELCSVTVGQPVFHIKEPDAPSLYSLVTFVPGKTDPETDAITIALHWEDECDEVSKTVLVGRAGLLEWYLANVGYSPDEDINGQTPIEELIDMVASHLLLRAQENPELFGRPLMT